MGSQKMGSEWWQGESKLIRFHDRDGLFILKMKFIPFCLFGREGAGVGSSAVRLKHG